MASSMVDELHEECGVIGIWGLPRAVHATAMGLHAMQHRGQESSGVAVSDGLDVRHLRAMGLVSRLTEQLSSLPEIPGSAAIGHVRYSTAGGSLLLNAQPFLIRHKRGPLAIAHNGNLINAGQLRRQMEELGHIFQSTSDTETILHLIARHPGDDLDEAVRHSLAQVKGSYCVVLLARDRLYVGRDPLGIRPLCLGRLDKSWIVASESCAFDLLGATYVRDIEPGELLVIDEKGPRSLRIAESGKPAHCIFEYVYFSRPDSLIFGHSCDKIRRRLGKQLAHEAPAEADVVIAVPDSSNTAALGFSQRSGIRFEIGLLRNHYVGRTFIDPTQAGRESKVKLKFNPISGVLKGRRVVLVDDSIVRGTTLRSLCRMVREAGASEIHVRISSPPVRHPCFYGMDFPTEAELLASNMSVEDMRKYLGVESLGYLSIEGMVAAARELEGNFCTGCFSGAYPDEELNKGHRDQISMGL
ncbi:MAG TPA: amidophosphoribosyltransferase [Fibrobacteria bacterium]|nr:amidophosphoribosyltransferase [Fibrobacteria bacterium]HOX50467.1 amidophosphoribosyltransferase [Fibrobacteria bacterium]